MRFTTSTLAPILASVLTILVQVVSQTSSSLDTGSDSSVEVTSSEKTSFSCSGRSAGYYADISSNCQIYHMCDEAGRLFSHACPERTRFQQRTKVCDHWYMVECSGSEAESTQLSAAAAAVASAASQGRSEGRKSHRHSQRVIAAFPYQRGTEPPRRSSSKNSEIVTERFKIGVDSNDSPRGINKQISSTTTSPSSSSQFTSTQQQPQLLTSPQQQQQQSLRQQQQQQQQLSTSQPQSPRPPQLQQQPPLSSSQPSSPQSQQPQSTPSRPTSSLLSTSTQPPPPTIRTATNTAAPQTSTSIFTPRKHTENIYLITNSPPLITNVRNEFPGGFTSAAFNNQGGVISQFATPYREAKIERVLIPPKTTQTQSTPPPVPDKYTNNPYFESYFKTSFTISSPTSPRTTSTDNYTVIPEEADEIENRIEIVIPDPRKMFYIPDSNYDPGDLSEGQSTVLVIELPVKNSMKFQRESASSVRNHDCPQCHPSFLLPGQCSPCVLIR